MTTPDPLWPYGALCRLAVYGTLAPGRSNHHHVEGIPGRWLVGTVKGRLFENGWGAALGYPGIVIDPGGPEVCVHVLESVELPRHWDRLDAFEGSGYRRVEISVTAGHDQIPACIYELAAAPGPP